MELLQYTGSARREYIWAEDNDSQPKVFNHYIFLVITLIPISSTVLWFDLAPLAAKQQAISCFGAPTTHPSTKHYVIMSAKLLFPQTSFIWNEFLTFWGFKYSLVYGENQFFDYPCKYSFVLFFLAEIDVSRLLNTETSASSVSL